MGAPTITVQRALVQAGEKGAVHLAGQQNTGTWLGVCGRQVRGRDIRTWTGPDAVRLGDTRPEVFCPDCADLLTVIGQAVGR